MLCSAFAQDSFSHALSDCGCCYSVNVTICEETECAWLTSNCVTAHTFSIKCCCPLELGETTLCRVSQQRLVLLLTEHRLFFFVESFSL